MVHDLRASSFGNTVFAVVLLLIVGGAWGQEKQVSKPVTKDGLSLTISLDKSQYRPDEEIKLSFVLRNESKADIFVADGYLGPDYQEVGPGRHFEINLVDDNNTAVRFWSADLTEGYTLGIRKVFKLKPGEVYRGTVWLNGNMPNRAGTYETGNPGQRYEIGKDSTNYKITMRYQVKPESKGISKPPGDFTMESLWKGNLESEMLKLVLSQN